MLKKLRNKKTAKKVWIVLALLIVPAFILWGSGSLVPDKQKAGYAGKIFGRNVAYLEYKESYDAVRNQAIMQFGENFTQIEKHLNLESQAWERIILLREAKKDKIKVSDREVIKAIEGYPFFKNSKGQFDNQIYTQILRYVFRVMPRVFEEQTRQNLALAKLYDKVTSGILINEKELRQNYQRQNEEINIFYIASIPADFTYQLNPLEQEIKDYFAKQAFEFKQPASFNVEYISMAAPDKDETAIKNKVEDISSRLNKKEDFSKVAQELRLDLKETGPFAQTDPIPGIGWSPQISNLISKLKTGELSPVIHNDKYYYILRLKERKEPHIPDFSDVKDKVKATLVAKRSTEIAKEKINGCLQKLQEAYQANPGPVDFKETAKAFGLKSDSTELFKYGSYIAGIGASDIFWTVAYNLGDNEPSPVISLPTGFYIIKIKDRTPFDEGRFQAEKKDFAEKLIVQKKQEYFIKFYEELYKKATAGFKN